MFRLYFLRLAKYAYKYVRNSAIAQDLTQSVFLKIWELNGSWNPRGTIQSYLYTAVKNQCLNQLKHTKVRDEWESEESSIPKRSRIRMEWEHSDRESRLDRAIKQALDTMPDKRREVFLLSRDEGLTYQEIADLLGITKKTVENHMGNALQHLREELGDWI